MRATLARDRVNAPGADLDNWVTLELIENSMIPFYLEFAGLRFEILGVAVETDKRPTALKLRQVP